MSSAAPVVLKIVQHKRSEKRRIVKKGLQKSACMNEGGGNTTFRFCPDIPHTFLFLGFPMDEINTMNQSSKSKPLAKQKYRLDALVIV